jgi:hypothetical protein
VAVAAAAAALALAGCSGVDSFEFATPPDTTVPPTTSTTLPPDFTGAIETTVPGSTTDPALSLQPGKAALSGTVVGPTGPVGGASVEVDRFVGSRSADVRVTAGPDGAWSVPGIKGGRYRVRAWQAPTLAMTSPQVLFLGGTENRQVPLTLTAYGSQDVTASVNPQSAPVGEGIAVEVSVQSQSVDDQGFVSYQPAPGVSVQLAASGGAVQAAANPVTTDAGGLATFTLSCVADGSVTGTVTTATGGSASLPTLGCYTLAAPTPIVAPPPPSTTSTTTPGAPTSSTSSTTTSTTVPGLP